MSQSPFPFRPTLVSHPARAEPLPVFEAAQCNTLDESLVDAPASGHRVFTSLCNESAWSAVERLVQLDKLNPQLAKAGCLSSLR
jgi:hypothetical protein